MERSYYRETRSGDRVAVSPGCIRIERATSTSNPHQPARKWYVVARPKDAAAYAAKKLAAGAWQSDDRCYHVNGGERTVDGWTCDDCGQFFPLGTVVEGQRG